MPPDFAKVAKDLHLFDAQSLELILYESEQGRLNGDRRPHLATFDRASLSPEHEELIRGHVDAGLGTLIEISSL